MPPGRTLARAATVEGVGLFTARPSRVTIAPAPERSGITFVRADLPGRPAIPARVDRVVSEPARLGLPLPTPVRCTILAGDSPHACVITVEHVMSALAGLGVTEARIEVEGPELPACDGSAQPFVRAMLDAGLVDHEHGPDPIVPTRAISVGTAASGTIVAEPCAISEALYRYALDYGPGAPIAPATASWRPGDDYARSVAPARTFCLAAEAQAMRSAGLLAHLSPRDMLVIGHDGPVDNEYRFPDEPAHHKLLDLIGDLALAGRPIHARITATRTGHLLNHALAAALLASASA